MSDARNPLGPPDTKDRTELSQEAEQRVEANVERARELKQKREQEKQAKAGS